MREEGRGQSSLAPHGVRAALGKGEGIPSDPKGAAPKVVGPGGSRQGGQLRQGMSQCHVALVYAEYIHLWLKDRGEKILEITSDQCAWSQFPRGGFVHGFGISLSSINSFIEQPDLPEGVSAHGRGLEQDEF